MIATPGDATVRSRTPRLRAAVCALAVSLIGVTAGCGVAHPGITNGAVSDCFRALPAARTAIRSPRARLLGVHLLAADDVPRLNGRPSPPAELDTTVCAVAFQGTFVAGQVTGAAGGSSGRYAVVLVNEKKLTIVASFVGDHLPRRLKGRTV